MKRGLLTILVSALAAVPSLAETEANRPSECPYCEGDPRIMAKARIVSHGGFEFGETDTHAVDQLLPNTDIRWIETSHFELGFAFAPYKPKAQERKKIRAELEELSTFLPNVNPKTKTLDPWLRIHLYAQRVEKHWDRFLEIMQVDEEDFPPAGETWIVGTPYMGEGPYLGQEGKFEFLVVPSISVQVAFLRSHFGLKIEKTQRWNVVSRDSLIVVASTENEDLRNDSALHNHVVFNLTVCMVDGYKHYSYETPIWLREGLAHYLEREISPDFNTFDSAEGGVAETTRKSDWEGPVKKMIQSGKAPRMARLANLQSFADLTLEDHYATWSMTAFLVEEHPEGYAKLNANIHGIKDADGLPDGSGMRDKHRKFFLECLGMSYASFDETWQEWALSR